MSVDLAVIGGTGLYRLAALQDEQALEGDTIYGRPSAPVRVGKLGGKTLAFLARHGEGHSVPPHLVNYRANLRRLADLGVRRVLIADDILDEGHTLKAVRDWCEDQGAVEVKIAVLCVKKHDRRVEGIDADYIALEVPDSYVYGYGMDYHEQGRNLPGIYALVR